MKNKKYKIIILLIFTLIIMGCQSIDVSNKREITKKEAENIAINYVLEKTGEIVFSKDIGISRFGKSNWKMVIYSEEHYYEIEVSTTGEVKKYANKNYEN